MENKKLRRLGIAALATPKKVERRPTDRMAGWQLDLATTEKGKREGNNLDVFNLSGGRRYELWVQKRLSTFLVFCPLFFRLK